MEIKKALNRVTIIKAFIYYCGQRFVKEVVRMKKNNNRWDFLVKGK